MTGDVDATDRWGAIFHGSGTYVPQHSRRQWGRIDDAIRTADRAWTDQATTDPARHTPPAVRGDDAWCRIAADTYDMLTASGAYWHLDNDVAACAADEHLIRAWLDAPWVPPGDEPMTMAQAQGLDEEFAADHGIDPTSLHILVDLAQRAGVFGGPRHHISLLRWAENGNLLDDAFVVTVRPLDGPGTGSPQVGIEELVRDRTTPVSTVVGVLHGVARVVNDVVATTRTPTLTAVPDRRAERTGAPADDSRPPPAPSRTTSGFPPLRLVHSATDTNSDPPTPPAAGGGRRR
ncbi:MAG: hypothetical protein QOE61_162 [Micromonosporaceae bacterium]|jgi:hypothetical protein|nr:hypothetical protein [Micromonosporaceae bacterium]